MREMWRALLWLERSAHSPQLSAVCDAEGGGGGFSRLGKFASKKKKIFKQTPRSKEPRNVIQGSFDGFASTVSCM